jgi:hypothetical protein
VFYCFTCSTIAVYGELAAMAAAVSRLCSFVEDLHRTSTKPIARRYTAHTENFRLAG